MRFVVFDGYRVGLADDRRIHDVSPVIPEPWRGSRFAMNYIVEHFDDGMRARLEQAARDSEPLDFDAVRLQPPVPQPMQLLAAPANNRAHAAEMRSAGFSGGPGGPFQQGPREAGFFLKAPGSMCGPSDAIELPDMPGRRFDHEGELAVVIGRDACGVAEGDALSHVFGYTGLLDITLRTDAEHHEERPMRKSFASFTPVGPALVTADEIPDPNHMQMCLWVNQDLRQDANTSDLIVGVAELIARASRVLPLHPGDLYTTGSPSGVGPIHPGDVVTMELERVGQMKLPVRVRSW